MRPRLVPLAAACLGIAVASPGAAFAAPGDLDPTFSGDGKTTIDFGRMDTASDVALQSDGKAVVVGATDVNSPLDIARLTRRGSLDKSFGRHGKLKLYPFGSRVSFSAHAVAIQPDGKILVGGTTDADSARDFGVVRLNSDGSLDTTFGGGGVMTVGFDDVDSPSATDQLDDLALDSDGRIVLVGAAHDNESWGIVRLNSDGSLDTSFDVDGKTTVDWGERNLNEFATAVVIQPDGRLVVAGWFNHGALSYTAAVARLTADGSLDTSFAGTGQETIAFGGRKDTLGDVALQGDGKIILAGTTKVLHGSNTIALARLTGDGALDPSFSGAGTEMLRFGSSSGASSILVQPDGRIVIGGDSVHAFGLLRIRSDGSLDKSFSGDGKQTIDFPGIAGISSLGLQPNGSIVAAGSTGDGYLVDFALARVGG